MSPWEELGTTSTKILNDLPNLKKGHRQAEDGVTAKVTTIEACAKKFLDPEIIENVWFLDPEIVEMFYKSFMINIMDSHKICLETSLAFL